MNALLQHRGHVLMGAGHSIAVQNFNENIGILVMVGLYALMVRAGIGVNAAIVLFGLFVSGAMVLVMLRHRCNQARGDSLHLIGAIAAGARRRSPRRSLERTRSRGRPAGREARCAPAPPVRGKCCASSALISAMPALDALGEAAGAKRRLHLRGRSRSHAASPTCAWMPRSATISTSRSASSR